MVLIERTEYNKNYTLGKLTFDDFECVTIERPWANNQPFFSCVPVGKYDLCKFNSLKFGKVYALNGNGICISEGVNCTRYAILIHPANLSSELQGCIALGDQFGIINGQKAVLNSKKTVSRFYDLIKAMDNIPLEIK